MSEQPAQGHDGLPSLGAVLEGTGLVLVDDLDGIAPLAVPDPLFTRIQQLDREQAAVTARKQDLLELAIDLLGIDRTLYRATIDLDSGAVTRIPREDV